eukprot:sb/3472829/
MMNNDFREPTDTRKQSIRSRYLGHVTGYQPIRDQYFLIRSVPGILSKLFHSFRSFKRGAENIETKRCAVRPSTSLVCGTWVRDSEILSTVGPQYTGQWAPDLPGKAFPQHPGKSGYHNTSLYLPGNPLSATGKEEERSPCHTQPGHQSPPKADQEGGDNT